MRVRRRLLERLTLTIVAALCPFVVSAQTRALTAEPLSGSGYSVTPLSTVSLGITLPADRDLNATDSPVNIPMATGTDTTLFQAGNVIKIDNEYFLLTAVTPSTHDDPAAPGFTGYSRLTASRAQLGSTAAAHGTHMALLRVYQLDVLLASPNTAIGAYQLNVNYDSARLSLISVNVFPGTGALGTPVAVNTNDPGVIIVNSFNANTSFKATATPVARVYFTGTAPGTANISVSLTNLADATGNDLDSAPNGITSTLGAPSLTVTAFNALRKGRGQITSQ